MARPDAWRYVGDGRYETASVQRALRPATVPVGVLGAVLIGVAATGSGTPAVVVLAGVVTGKLGLDLASVYSDRLAAFDERTATEFCCAGDPDDWPTDCSGPGRSCSNGTAGSSGSRRCRWTRSPNGRTGPLDPVDVPATGRTGAIGPA